MAAKKKAAKSKALAKTKKGGALALYDYGDDAGAGYENTDQSDFAIPFLSVLQTNSPECEKNHAKQVEGAEAGMLMNTVTKELFDGSEGLTIIPCDTSHVFTEWVPRDEGGGGGAGFRGIHEIDSDLVKACKAAAAESGAFGKLPTEDKTELVETFYIFGLLLDDVDATEPSAFVMIPFTSTKIKVYKGLLYRLRMFKGNPPLFANRVKLASFPDSNKKGNFYNFKCEPAVENDVGASLIPPVVDGEPNPLMVAAKQFQKQIRSGAARGAYESVEGTGDGDASGDEVF